MKFNRGDIDGKKLETIQKLGQHAYAMRAYIEWIASNYRLTMATNMSFYADDLRAFRAAEGLDGRQPEDLAHLLTGFRAFLLFALDLGVITAAEMEERIIAGRGALLDVARGQTTETRGASHEARYIALVSDAIRSGRYRLVDAAAPLTDDALGWVDDKHVYLDPGITQAAIVLLARERNEAPPLPTSALYERLVHAGLASPPNEKGRAGTRRSLGGGRVRVIEFALSVFEDLVLERMARHRDAANDPEIVRALEDEPVVAEPAPNASSPERMIDDAHSTETARRGSLAPDGTRLVCPVVGPPRLAIRAGEASTIYAVSIDGTIVDAATFTYTLPEGEALETLRRRVAAIKPEGLRAHLERIDGSWIIEKIEPVVDEAA